MKQNERFSIGIRVKVSADKTLVTVEKEPNQVLAAIEYPAGTTREVALCKTLSVLKKSDLNKNKA